MAPTNTSHRACGTTCHVPDLSPIILVDPFLIVFDAPNTTFSIPCRIEKILCWVIELIIIIAPAVQHVADGRVDVKIPTNMGKLVKYPSDITCLRLGEWFGPMKCLVVRVI